MGLFCFVVLICEEWLVDRKRIPSDWRKRMAVIRAKISKEFPSLPKDIDTYLHTLDPEGTLFYFYLLSFFFLNSFWDFS